MKRTFVMALALALCACGGNKDNDKPKAGDTAGDKGDKPAPPADQPIEALFSGPKVQFPPPAAKLQLGMPEAAAKAAAPDVFAAKYGYKVPGFKGVELNVQIENAAVYQVYLKLDEPIDKVAVWMEKKWGKPRASKNSIGSPEYYFDSPEVGLRAKLEKYANTSSMLRYSTVMSKDQFLGADPKLWGFEKTSLIGTSQDELLKTFADRRPTPRKDDPESIVLNFPPLTTSEYGSSVDARIKAGKVTGFVVSISTGGDAPTDAAVAARLEQLYGKGKDDRGMYLDFPGPPTAKAELRKDSGSFAHTVWVGDHKK